MIARETSGGACYKREEKEDEEEEWLDFTWNQLLFRQRFWILRPILVGVDTSTRFQMAIVPFISHRDWLSSTLLRYGVIREPLPRIVSDEDVFESGDSDEDDDKYLKSLNPTKWKEQDHYAVLGLKKKRFYATEGEVRRKYRKKILIHHPDKRGDVVDRDNDYFACITKAFEMLGDPVKRRSYDSVDPFFDDDIPSSSTNSKKNFFKIFAPVFERNSRWSEIQPVPQLGNSKSTRDEVDKFYSFWYDFKSWREYSYQDEEDKEKGSDREERRWIEKENRAVRESKKKEEVSRIRKLVDNAYSCDPRIAVFKEQEKLEKLRAKEARENERKRRKEEEARKLEEERKAAEKRLEEEESKLKARREAEKKEKDAIRKQKKLVRKQVHELLTDEYVSALDGKEKINAMTKLEYLLHDMSLEDLQNLRSEVEHCTDLGSKKMVIASKLDGSCKNRVSETVQKKVESLDQNSNLSSTKKWSIEECNLLHKASKLFPPGTSKRWEVITNYFNLHSGSGITRKEREVLQKYHELQDPASSKSNSLEASHSGTSTIYTANGATVNSSVVDAAAIPSERYDTPAAQQGSSANAWTAEEQVILEQALKTYPKEMPKPERWSKIASCLPGRSVKECLERYKYVAGMVRDKREAQQLISKQKK